jgi:uncharacterized protein YjdB
MKEVNIMRKREMKRRTIGMFAIIMFLTISIFAVGISNYQVFASAFGWQNTSGSAQKSVQTNRISGPQNNIDRSTSSIDTNGVSTSSDAAISSAASIIQTNINPSSSDDPADENLSVKTSDDSSSGSSSSGTALKPISHTSSTPTVSVNPTPIVSSEAPVSSDPVSSDPVSSESSSGHSSSKAQTISITGISVNKTELDLKKGETTALTAAVTPSDTTESKAITWSSSNSGVVTVDSNGKVTAVEGGDSTITAKSSNGKTASCSVSVSVPATKVTLNLTNIALEKSGTHNLTAVLEPADTTDTVSWATSDNNIVSIDKNGVITAIAGGSATITASAANGTVKATCQVTVGVSITQLSLDDTFLSLKKGDSKTLTATITPADTTEAKAVTWSSSNTSVATVNSNGKITAVEGGTAVITALNGTHSAQCAVTVSVPATGITLNNSDLTIDRGSSQTLTAKILPDDTTDSAVDWTSSDANVADVDGFGKVTAVSAGQAVITAKSHDGGFTATCTVHVFVSISKLTLDQSTLNLKKGDTQALTATITPPDTTEDKTIVWTSSDDAVALVDNSGTITAVEGGTATITAKVGSHVAECTVTVTVPVTGISLDKTTLTMTKGTDSVLTPTIAPTDATDKAIEWSSSDNSVCSTDSSGKITANSVGTATITATTHDGGFTAQCAVTVVIPVTGISLNKSATVLIKGNTESLIPTISPTNATDQAVTWKSSDPNVATVDSSGKITAVEGGSAIITVKTHDGGFTAQCTVTVTVPVSGISLNKSSTSLIKGTTETLTATVAPDDATDKAIFWSSSNSSVASVDSSGLITAQAVGNATITVTTHDGNHSAQCLVTVTPDQFTITANATNGSVTGAGTYHVGSTVTLTAVPDTHYHFVQWNDGDTNVNKTVNVTQNINLVAQFAIDTFHVTYGCNAGGSVSYTNKAYEYGTNATLTAVPDAHYHFVQWNDGDTNVNKTVCVTQNVNLVAKFAIDTFSVTATAGANGTVTGGGTYAYGTYVTLTALPNTGYVFTSWSDGDTSSSKTVTVTGNINYSASFTVKYTIENSPPDSFKQYYTESASFASDGSFTFSENCDDWSDRVGYFVATIHLAKPIYLTQGQVFATVNNINVNFVVNGGSAYRGFNFSFEDTNNYTLGDGYFESPGNYTTTFSSNNTYVAERTGVYSDLKIRISTAAYAHSTNPNSTYCSYTVNATIPAGSICINGDPITYAQIIND